MIQIRNIGQYVTTVTRFLGEARIFRPLNSLHLRNQMWIFLIRNSREHSQIIITHYYISII